MDLLIRHDLRNRFASIRNALFYLKTRVQKRTGLCDADPRVPAFFALIDEELQKAEALIAPRAEQAPCAQAPQQRSRRVLLVDDDEAVSVTLCALLEEEGIAVDSARSLAQARACLEGDADYSLVLLDMNLGDGSGLDLLPGLRARLPEARVLAIGASMEATSGLFDAIAQKEHAFSAALDLLGPKP